MQIVQFRAVARAEVGLLDHVIFNRRIEQAIPITVQDDRNHRASRERRIPRTIKTRDRSRLKRPIRPARTRSSTVKRNETIARRRRQRFDDKIDAFNVAPHIPRIAIRVHHQIFHACPQILRRNQFARIIEIPPADRVHACPAAANHSVPGVHLRRIARCARQRIPSLWRGIPPDQRLSVIRRRSNSAIGHHKRIHSELDAVVSNGVRLIRG